MFFLSCVHVVSLQGVRRLHYHVWAVSDWPPESLMPSWHCRQITQPCKDAQPFSVGKKKNISQLSCHKNTRPAVNRAGKEETGKNLPPHFCINRKCWVIWLHHSSQSDIKKHCEPQCQCTQYKLADLFLLLQETASLSIHIEAISPNGSRKDVSQNNKAFYWSWVTTVLLRPCGKVQDTPTRRWREWRFLIC